MRLVAVTLFGCLAAAPLAVQQPAVSAPPPPPVVVSDTSRPDTAGGPRLKPELPSYRPAVTQRDATVATAADKTTITISTLGLVLIAVLLIILLT